MIRDILNVPNGFNGGMIDTVHATCAAQQRTTTLTPLVPCIGINGTRDMRQ